jgi:hypothetical protein
MNLVHAKIVAAMTDKFVNFLKGAIIENFQHTLPGSHFAGFVMLSYLVRAAGLIGFFQSARKLIKFLLVR